MFHDEVFLLNRCHQPLHGCSIFSFFFREGGCNKLIIDMSETPECCCGSAL